MFLPFFLSAGNTWQNVLPGTEVRSFVRGPDGLQYAVCPSCILYSEDQGMTWDSLTFDNSVISDISSLIFTADSGHMILSAEAGLFRSRNKGKTWDRLDQKLVGVYSMAVDAQGFIYASGSGGMLRSSDNGHHWDMVHGSQAGFTDGILCTPAGQVYASSIIAELFKSDDAGASWDTITAVPGLINALTVSPVSGTVFAGGTLAGNLRSRAYIYLSIDRGISWIPSDTNGIMVDGLYADEEGIIYAGRANIIVSYDDGLSWESYSEGLTVDNQIQTIYRTGDVLLAGDRNWGIYRNDIPTAINKNHSSSPENFHLYQNFPNPFNPATNIEFRIHDSESVSLRIYDILGREISTLIDQQLQADTYKVQWDGSRFAGGVYFYILKAGTERQTRKMILLR